MDDNRYTQLAAAWGVDVDDASLQLLREFDRLLAPLQGQTDRLDGNVTQWNSITAQLLALSQTHMSETKALSRIIETLSTSSDNLSQILQTLAPQIESQNQTLSQLQPEVTSLSQKQQEIGSSIGKLPKLLSHSEGRLAQQIGALKGRAWVWWVTPLVLAAAIGGLSFYFGHREGKLDGQVEFINSWFGDVSNADYWKQLRNLNQERMKRCLDEGRTECTLELP